jgi:hypothetical protein
MVWLKWTGRQVLFRITPSFGGQVDKLRFDISIEPAGFPAPRQHTNASLDVYGLQGYWLIPIEPGG